VGQAVPAMPARQVRHHRSDQVAGMTEIEPGWYKDPAESTTQRYWDGEGWVGDPLPLAATPPPGPPAVKPAPPPAPLPSISPTTQVPSSAPPAPAPPVPIPPGFPARMPPPWMYQLPRNVVPRPHGHQLAPVERRLAARAIDIVAVLALNVVVNGWFAYQWWL